MKRAFFGLAMILVATLGRASADCSSGTLTTGVTYTCTGVYLNAVMPVAYDYAIHPGAVKFSLSSGTPASLGGSFWIREEDTAIDRFTALLLKAQELNRPINFEFVVDPAYSNIGLIKSMYFN